MINKLDKKYEDQCWLVAHNAWQTNQGPAFNNQVKTITELLDYGVRGFAMDIYGDDEDSLHLQHNHGNPATSVSWETIITEIATWMKKPENGNEIVSLFFESYLKGPDGTTQQNALEDLSKSLVKHCGNFYIAGKKYQTTPLKTRTLRELITGGMFNNSLSLPQRLFAFLEKEPDEGSQELFPIMTDLFAENVYGDKSLNKNSWNSLRKGSNATNPFTFMNHFGNAPSYSEWERNNPELIEKHAHSFIYHFGGRFPNFISLDKINWEDNNPNSGPITATQKLQALPDAGVIGFNWLGSNDCDDYTYTMAPEGKLISLTVRTEKGKGITAIIPQIGVMDPTQMHNLVGVDAIEVVNVPKYGLVNLRFRMKGGNWGDWLTPFEKSDNVTAANKKTYEVQTDIVGICTRKQSGYGVTDFAIAYRK
jgi:hypothetical protein